MNRTLITFGLAALLGLGFCALSPLSAKEPPQVPPPNTKGGELPADKPLPPDPQKQIQDLQEQIKKLRDDLNTDPRLLKVKELDGDVKRLTEDVRNLKAQQEQMEKRILDKLDQMERRSNPPRVATEVYGQVPTGNIRLVNRSDWPASIFLNGVDYRLLPGEERTLAARPVGAFSYEVAVDGFGLIQPLVARTLAANETRVITINR